MDVDNSDGFSELVQQAEQLTAEIDGSTELPRIERNLRQILEAGQELWSRTAQTTSKDTSDVKASILLGTKGYDLIKISNKLEKLSASKPLEAAEPIQETDIHGFLKNERENAILSIIDDCKKNTYLQTENLYWKNFMSNWEQQKSQILFSLLTSSKDVVDISMDVPETTLSSSLFMKSRSALNNIEMAYAKEIFLYNEQSILGSTLRYNLAEHFYEMTKKLDEKNVTDLWEQVKYMIEVPHNSESDVLSMRSLPQMQAAFASQAIKYLEKKFLGYIQNVVEGNLQQAHLGGIPGTYFLIRSFLNIKMPIAPPSLEDIHIDGIPVWPIIYYCMRCGDLNAALQVAQRAGQNCQNLSEFASFLKEYMDSDNRRLSPTNEGKVNLLYRSSIRTSTDPFKKIVYSILGCCDLSDNHSEVANKTEDYLWMRLCQLRPEDTDVSQDKLTFSKFQTLLYEEFGEKYFNAHNQPFLYFKVLFITAQFEAAIEFLSRIERLRCHAVHIAIVLYKLKLIALPSSSHASLLSQSATDKPPMKRLNFARLIRLYTRKFESTDPREAIQYFYLLKDLKGIHGENLFVSSITDLVQETKEYEMLLGRMEPDGCRKPGLIDKFQEDTQKIIEMVANDSETKGNIEEAIRLYDLASKHVKVLDLLNKLLTQVVPQAPTPGSNRDRLENYALSIAERYRTLDTIASRDTSDTFYLLLDLMTFFNQYHSKQHIQALDTLQRLKIIPLTLEEVEEKVAMLSQYSEEIRRNLPDILLASMNILYAQYKTIKVKSPSKAQVPSLFGSQLEDTEQERNIQFLKKKAEAIIRFAGSISYHLPGDTNARLLQIKILMN